MATNHTQNYQLNLWQKTDRFLMDDFNADNQKLDAALKADADAIAALSQTVSALTQNDLLFDLDLTAEAAQLLIPLPAGYWSKYRQLVMYAGLKGSYSTASLFLSDPPEANSVMETGGYFASSSHASLNVASASEPAAASFSRVTFDLSAPRACTHVCTACCYPQSSSDPDDIRSTGSITFHASRTLTWEQVSQIKLTSGKALQPGSWVRLYGIR